MTRLFYFPVFCISVVNGVVASVQHLLGAYRLGAPCSNLEVHSIGRLPKKATLINAHAVGLFSDPA